MQTIYKTIQLSNTARIIDFPAPAAPASSPFNYEAMELRARRRYRRAALCDTVAAVCDIVIALAFAVVLVLGVACFFVI